MTMTEESGSPERIEQEIRSTRADIDQKLDVLQERFSPGQLVDQAIGYVKGGSGDFARNLGQAVRDNPVPVVLLGASLAWLTVASTRKQKPNDRQPSASRPADVDGTTPASRHPEPAAGRTVGHDAAASTGGRAASGADAEAGLGSKVADLTDRANEQASEVAGSVRQKFDEAGEQARSLAARARRQGAHAKDAAQNFIDENPLVVGALGVAVGAAIAAVLPATRQENEALGAKADEIKRAATETASQHVDKAKNVAKTAVDSAAREAGLKSSETKDADAGSQASDDRARPRPATKSGPSDASNV